VDSHLQRRVDLQHRLPHEDLHLQQHEDWQQSQQHAD
jgi:hypothetical protein